MINKGFTASINIKKKHSKSAPLWQQIFQKIGFCARIIRPTKGTTKD
jgi:hypothetical protein